MAASSAGVDKETARRYLQRIRQRIMNDETISGWMGGGLNSLPASDHAIWGKLYDCLLECPAYRTLHSNIPLSESKGENASLGQRRYMPKLSAIAQYDAISRRAICQKPCPIDLTFEVSHRLYRELGNMVSVYGQIPRKNFKEWFFEANFRVNTRVDNVKYRGAEPFTIERFLDALEKKPL